MKTCTKCHETKAVELFSRDAKCRDGRSSWCRACLYRKQQESRKRKRALLPPLPRKTPFTADERKERARVSWVKRYARNHRYMNELNRAAYYRRKARQLAEVK